MDRTSRPGTAILVTAGTGAARVRAEPTEKEVAMDDETARALLEAERARVEDLLQSSRAASGEDRSAQESEIATSDAAEPLAAEGVDQAVTASLVRRLDAVHRAMARLEAGTYGRSVRSGQPIPDERLEADPTAELTIEEARADAAHR